MLFILVYLKTYASRWCTGAYSGWSRAKPISGFTCSCPRCWPRCAPSAMPRPDPSRLSRNGWVFPEAAASVPLAEAPPPSAPVAGANVPPLPHDGTERRIVRPQDPPAQTDCYSGKKKDHTLKNVLLVNALLVILFLSDTHGTCP